MVKRNNSQLVFWSLFCSYFVSRGGIYTPIGVTEVSTWVWLIGMGGHCWSVWISSVRFELLSGPARPDPTWPNLDPNQPIPPKPTLYQFISSSM